MQHIFLVETNKKCKSDEHYIRALLNERYDYPGDKISFIYMESKTKYDKVESKVENLKNKYFGESKIYICIDLDEANNENIILNNKIIQYSNKNKYNLIWFYENIEMVFWGKKISDKYKCEEAVKFRNKKEIKNTNFNKLSKIEMYKESRTSNIIEILDKELKIKY